MDPPWANLHAPRCRGWRPRHPPQHTAKVSFHARRILTHSIVGRADPACRAAAPYRFPNLRRIRSRPFLPPAGEGGIRRSPARRMTEEGEPHRLQAAKSPAFLTAACHFHGVVPSCSPSPAAARHPPPLVEGKDGRPWIRRALFHAAAAARKAKPGIPKPYTCPNKTNPPAQSALRSMGRGIANDSFVRFTAVRPVPVRCGRLPSRAVPRRPS